MAAQPVRTQIRLPSVLHQQLTSAALKSGRSFNSEMIQRLEASFAEPSSSVSPLDSNPSRVALRAFQQQMLEGVRKIVRMEALLGAARLTREQQAELAQLKKDLGYAD